MKAFILLTCLSISTAASVFAQSDSAPTAAISRSFGQHGAASAASTSTQQPAELERLQQEFDRRRAAALRPVAAWYRSQLEALQQTPSNQSPEAQAALAQALVTAREAYWQDDQPELKQALLAATWLWRSSDSPNGVNMTFHADGGVEHIGMHGVWRVTGPCEVTIRTDAHDQYVLRFNASLSAYEADRNNVSGQRIASLR